MSWTICLTYHLTTRAILLASTISDRGIRAESNSKSGYNTSHWWNRALQNNPHSAYPDGKLIDARIRRVLVWDLWMFDQKASTDMPPVRGNTPRLWWSGHPPCLCIITVDHCMLTGRRLDVSNSTKNRHGCSSVGAWRWRESEKARCFCLISLQPKWDIRS